jgi:hypothetical protein
MTEWGGVDVGPCRLPLPTTELAAVKDLVAGFRDRGFVE